MRKFEYEFKYYGQYQFKNCSGIYAIVNLLNNKKYVGHASDMRRRYRQHYNDLVKQKHANNILQRAFNKYGERHFSFWILEKCENVKDTLLMIEQKYIDECGDYNIATLATGGCGKHAKGHYISKEQRKIIAEANRKRIWSKESLKKKSEYMLNSDQVIKQRKKVLQYSLDGTLINEFQSIMDAAKFLGNVNSRVSIKRCCQKKQKTAYNFIWRFKNDIQDGIE